MVIVMRERELYIITLTLSAAFHCVVVAGSGSSTKRYVQRVKRRISPVEASIRKMKTCDQTEIPAMNFFDVDRFSGDWYELGKTVSGYADPDDGKWTFTNNYVIGGYNFAYEGRSRDGGCMRPIEGRIAASPDNPGELMMNYWTRRTKVIERIRVLDTDYETFAAVYTCMHVTSDGNCHPTAVMGAMWTRSSYPNVHVYNKALDILNAACIDSLSILIKIKHGQGICPPVDWKSEEEQSEGHVETTCKNTSTCALHCPPCCREKSDGCIQCDCVNAVVDKFVNCLPLNRCPLHCASKKMYPGCYTCECPDKIFEKIKSSVCLEEDDAGSCTDEIDRYYYDVTAGKCKKFSYTGCGGSKNNFETLSKCVETCLGTHLTRSSDHRLNGSTRVMPKSRKVVITFALILIHFVTYIQPTISPIH